MGMVLHQLVNAMKIVKGYFDTELSESERRTSAQIQALYDVITDEKDDILHILDRDAGIEDTPIGHIMAYMGKKAPKHYLICDGTEYEVAAFPMLATHILTEFGNVNYFGGDGVNTFCVPDLRGEFLRGAGTNSHNDEGDGADVGDHQSGTRFNGFDIVNETLGMWVSKLGTTVGNNAGVSTGVNHDKCLAHRTGAVRFSKNATNSTEYIEHPSVFTARPTNTSVLYCIKYEPTFYLQTGSNAGKYSNDAIQVGTWIDGRPILRRVYQCTYTVTTLMDTLPLDPIEQPFKLIRLWGITSFESGAQAPIPYAYPSTDQSIGIFVNKNGEFCVRSGNYHQNTATNWLVVADYVEGTGTA